MEQEKKTKWIRYFGYIILFFIVVFILIGKDTKAAESQHQVWICRTVYDVNGVEIDRYTGDTYYVSNYDGLITIPQKYNGYTPVKISIYQTISIDEYRQCVEYLNYIVYDNYIIFTPNLQYGDISISITYIADDVEIIDDIFLYLDYVYPDGSHNKITKSFRPGDHLIFNDIFVENGYKIKNITGRYPKDDGGFGLPENDPHYSGKGYYSDINWKIIGNISPKHDEGIITIYLDYAIKFDYNDDGIVNSKDALDILKAASGLADIRTSKIESCDINGDGVITSKDALYILRYSAGLEIP